MNINERDIRRRIKAAEKYIPPFELADQQAVIFNYRMSLQICLVLLERVEEKEKHIKRLIKGNSDLTRILEDWLIANACDKKPRIRRVRMSCVLVQGCNSFVL